MTYSMREVQTSYDIANAVRFARCIHKGSILLVEGDFDVSFFEKLLNITNCKIVAGTNKEKVN